MLNPLDDRKLQERFGRLRGMYWNLRACRPYQRAIKQRWWRRIQAEKLELLRSGVPHIEVHLWCRFFVNPRSETYKERLNGYYGANMASRFSSGIGWQTSEARQDCPGRIDDQLVRLSAKRSMNNVYYVKHKRCPDAFPNTPWLLQRLSPRPLLLSDFLDVTQQQDD